MLPEPPRLLRPLRYPLFEAVKVGLPVLVRESESNRLSLTVQAGELDVGLALSSALWRFLFHRDHLSEGRDLLRRLLTVANTADRVVASSIMAKALFAASHLAVWQGDSPAGRADAGLERAA